MDGDGFWICDEILNIMEGVQVDKDRAEKGTDCCSVDGGSCEGNGGDVGDHCVFAFGRKNHQRAKNAILYLNISNIMISSNPPTLPQQLEYNAASTKQQGAEAYSFAAEPRAVQQRKKYRDPNELDGKGQYINA